MASFLKKLTPSERMFLLELSPSRRKDNSIFSATECIDAQIAEKELQLQKLRSAQQSSKRRNPSTVVPKRETNENVPVVSTSVRRSVSSIKPSERRPLSAKSANANPTLIGTNAAGSNRPQVMDAKCQVQTSVITDALSSAPLMDAEALKRKLILSSRPFADIEAHLSRLSRLNRLTDDRTIEQVDVPADYTVPVREVVSSDLQVLQNLVVELQSENANLRDEVTKARNEISERAKAETERHAQRDKLVTTQQRQLFGAVRRIEWLTEERKKMEQKNAEQRTYIIKLERRLMECLSSVSAPPVSRTANVTAAARNQPHSELVASSGPSDFSISAPYRGPSVVMSLDTSLSGTAQFSAMESLCGVDITAFEPPTQDTQ